MECRLQHSELDLFLELCLDVFHEDEISEGLLFSLDVSTIFSYQSDSIPIEKSHTYSDNEHYTDDDTDDDMYHVWCVTQVREHVGELCSTVHKWIFIYFLRVPQK